MKLYFSQARKRREQNIVRFCEALNMGAMILAVVFTVALLVRDLFN